MVIWMLRKIGQTELAQFVAKIGTVALFGGAMFLMATAVPVLTAPAALAWVAVSLGQVS